VDWWWTSAGLPQPAMPKAYPKKNLGPLTPTTLRDHVRFNGGKTVIQHFRCLDGNGDGTLTLKEFMAGVRSMGFLDATDDEVRFVFEWLDHDGSGVIPYKELDKKLRERPKETEAEKLAREQREEEMRAAEEAAARAAAVAERRVAKQTDVPQLKTQSPAADPRPVAFKRVPFTRELVQPKPTYTFKGFTGNERFVQPTLAANGYPLHNQGAERDRDVQWTHLRPTHASPVSGHEHFLRGTLGSASLGLEEADVMKPDEPSITPPEVRRPSAASSASSGSRTGRTRRASLVPSFSRRRPREASWSQAEKDLEARKEVEAARRERVREAAARVAERAAHNPLPTKHPQPWMPKDMASLVAEEEREKLATQRRAADVAAAGDASERASWGQLRMFEETVVNLGLPPELFGIVDDNEELWA